MMLILQSPLLCRFHLKFDADEGPEEGLYISQLSRNRVAAVIDCLNYLRYIKQGPNSIENFWLESWLEKQLEVQSVFPVCRDILL